MRQIDPVQIHRYVLILSSHVRLGQTRLFPSSFSSTTILCVFLNSPVGATNCALLNLLCLITSNTVVSEEQQKSTVSSTCGRNYCYRILFSTLLETEDIGTFVPKINDESLQIS